MKANALISELELAKRTFADDPRLGTTHLLAAVQALSEIGRNPSKAGMTHADWDYVANICASLDAVVTVFGSRKTFENWITFTTKQLNGATDEPMKQAVSKALHLTAGSRVV